MIRDGIMYHRIQDSQRGVVEQLVLPEKLRATVKTALHDDSGHLGFERTLQMIRFYWPIMFQDIKAWCEQCERCCPKTKDQKACTVAKVLANGETSSAGLVSPKSFMQTKGATLKVLLLRSCASVLASLRPIQLPTTPRAMGSLKGSIVLS